MYKAKRSEVSGNAIKPAFPGPSKIHVYLSYLKFLSPLFTGLSSNWFRDSFWLIGRFYFVYLPTLL